MTVPPPPASKGDKKSEGSKEGLTKAQITRANETAKEVGARVKKWKKLSDAKDVGGMKKLKDGVGKMMSPFTKAPFVGQLPSKACLTFQRSAQMVNLPMKFN